MKKKPQKAPKPSVFTRLSNKIAASSEGANDLPEFFRRRIQAYNVGAVAFVVFGVIALLMTRQIYTLLFGIFLAVCILVLRYLEMKRFAEKGFEKWHLDVLEHVYSKSPYRKVVGFYANALDGPYAGKTCHVALVGQGPIPPEGREVEICVPGELSVLPVRDVYYIPQYYGLELMAK